MIKTALIFAAGRGERLMPFTQTTPKPMLLVHDKPIIAYHLEKLAQVGVQHVFINHAYLGYKIRQYLGKGQGFGLSIHYLPEPPGALETAGTLAFFLKELANNEDLLLTINADIYTDYTFEPKIKLEPKSDGHLILVPTSNYFKKADFSLNPNGDLETTNANLIYAGIAYYRMRAFENLEVGRYSLRHWLFSKASRHQLTGEVYQGLWQDIGTVDRWLSLE